MRNDIASSISIAVLTIAAWAVGQIVYIAMLCPPHRAWQRVRLGNSEIVLDTGERVARAGDAIFVCETPHATGPIRWHLDLECYCAPAGTTAAALSVRVGGACVVDKLAPLRNDRIGACRRARCSQHVDF